jgi:hypothetical protein
MVDRTLCVFETPAVMPIMPMLINLNDIDGCIIVANYVEQLDDEETAKYSATAVEPAAPVTTYNNNYAFAKPDQSYGRQGNSSNV